MAGLLALVVRLSVLPLFPIPEPGVHDEFSYLLGAETFLEGRLTNPSHPLWEHFETLHVNHQPTYATKYPPAQSLFLALGQKAFGHPWYGVLLSVGLMCASICWMLQGWMRPDYAFLGSVVAIAEFGVSSYWVNSYWGGSVAAAAGALVLGALPRLVRREKLRDSLLGGFGTCLLALSRPYEGLILASASAAALVWWRKREGRPLHLLFTKRLVLPSAALLCFLCVWMGYYHYRVTGNVWVMPYAVNQQTYAATPTLWIFPEYPVPLYRHELIRKVYAEWYLGKYRSARANPFHVVRGFVASVVTSYSTPLLSSVVLAILLVPTRRVRIAAILAGTLALGMFAQVMVLPHYYAPATGLVMFLGMVGVQYTVRRIRKQVGAWKALNVLSFAGVFVAFFAVRVWWDARYAFYPFPAQRTHVVTTLLRQGTRHLVIVRYALDHDLHVDWVHNGASIDRAEIVWAHDLGEAANRRLLEYYPDRTVWLLEPDRFRDAEHTSAPPLRLYRTEQDNR